MGPHRCNAYVCLMFANAGTPSWLTDMRGLNERFNNHNWVSVLLRCVSLMGRLKPRRAILRVFKSLRLLVAFWSCLMVACPISLAASSGIVAGWGEAVPGSLMRDWAAGVNAAPVCAVGGGAGLYLQQVTTQHVAANGTPVCNDATRHGRHSCLGPYHKSSLHVPSFGFLIVIVHATAA